MERRHLEPMGGLGRQEVRVHFLDTHSGTRGLFTGPSQIDSDQALARALQEQERAYSFLGFNTRFIEYDGSASSSSVYVDHGTYRDGFASLDDGWESPTRRWQENDGHQLQTDEAFARALQDTVDHDELAEMMSLTGLRESNEAWHAERSNTEDDVDPDNLSYEELIALEEVLGSHNKGLSPEEIADLSITKYKTTKNSNNELCMVCLDEYGKGDTLINLPCNHSYHAHCIQKWLEISKICPICGLQVQIPRAKEG